VSRDMRAEVNRIRQTTTRNNTNNSLRTPARHTARQSQSTCRRTSRCLATRSERVARRRATCRNNFNFRNSRIRAVERDTQPITPTVRPPDPPPIASRPDDNHSLSNSSATPITATPDSASSSQQSSKQGTRRDINVTRANANADPAQRRLNFNSGDGRFPVSSLSALAAMNNTRSNALQPNNHVQRRLNPNSGVGRFPVSSLSALPSPPARAAHSPILVSSSPPFIPSPILVTSSPVPVIPLSAAA
jgi:hypothetical protein